MVLADVNDGPELPYRSRIAIVGSLYHPNIAGYMRLRADWRARNLAELPPELVATAARASLICPHHARSAMLDGEARGFQFAQRCLGALLGAAPGSRTVRRPVMTEPDWLIWTRELQAIAQSGLAFTKDPYDKERYELLRALAARIHPTE